MRNFSTTTQQSFVSCSINWDEYHVYVAGTEKVTCYADEVLGLVMRALAKAMQVPVEDLRTDFARLMQHGENIAARYTKLAPSEFEVLGKLERAYVAHLSVGDSSRLGPYPFTFIYTNLNTGHSVTWTVFSN